MISKVLFIIKCATKFELKYFVYLALPFFPIDLLIDPTGAGDTFGGGLMAALSNDCSLNEGVIWGNAAASFCVEGFGLEGLKKMTLESFEERVEKIKTLL